MVTRIVRGLAAITALAFLGAEVVPPKNPSKTSPDQDQKPAAASDASAVPTNQPTGSAPTAAAVDEDNDEEAPAAASAEPQKPVGPILPARGQTAVLEVLDKVTASSLRFGAPIGRPVQYKSLVFTVKTCQTRDAGGVRPQPAAYVVITSLATREPTEVFKGWIFAESPSLNGLQHPIYDAWLVACSAAAPVS